MAIDRVERRMAAIVAADMVSYSRLMEADETGTLAALKAHRSELIDSTIADYNGRIVKTTGDGMLVEFASVVDAMASTVAIQRAMVTRNEAVREDRRIEFRVGINLGDIIIDSDDIYGDGVNIAARLEQLAEPGGICISGTAYDQLKAQVDVGYADMGEQRVKNIEKPVRAYRVLLDADTAGTFVAAPQPRWRWQPAAVAALTVVLVIAVAGLVWWQPWVMRVAPTSVERMALPLPDKPSIAVLPFDNLGGDPEQDYFADGMTLDIITDLSKISGLFVIARNSSFAYTGKQTDVQAIAREIGVKYVLQGSVRRSGDQVRINAQLIDASFGRQLWAERYDGTMANIFALQDKITAQIVASLSVTLGTDAQTPAENQETAVPEAYDAFLAGWQHFRARTLEDYRTAQSWLEKAVVLDPQYSRAWATLASLHLESFQRSWTGELGISVDRMPELLAKALQRPTPLAYQVEAEWLMQQRRFDDAGTALDKASALDPNDPDTFVLKSTLSAIRGDTDTAIALMHTANRLDPHYPAYNLYRLGVHHLRAGDAATAIEFLERAQARNPGDWVPLVYLTVAYAETNRLDEANASAAALLARRKEIGFPITTSGSFGSWWNHAGAFGERIVAGLTKAGVPEKADPRQLNLTPENRLSGAMLREQLKSGYRNKGRIAGGVWMRDMDADGNGVHYWQGRQTATSTSEIRGDTQYTNRSNGMKQTCNFYRNPEGTKENLNEYIAVCSNGVFPYARFSLPEKTK